MNRRTKFGRGTLVLAVTLVVVLGSVAPVAAAPASTAAASGGDRIERLSTPWSPPTHAQTKDDGGGTNPASGMEFEIIDGLRNESGNVVVNVSNYGGVPASEFNVFYDGKTTPLNTTNGGVVGVVNTGGYTRLTLASAEATYSKSAVPIRITQGTGNTTYGATADSHRAVLTMNYVSFTATNATGTPLNRRPLVYYNASTNETLGMATTSQQGRFLQHCRGVLDGTDCVVPGTTTTSSVFTPNRLVGFGPGPTGITGEVRVDVFDLASSNGTAKATVTPGSHAALTADTPTAPHFIEPSQLGGSYLTPTEFVVTERETGTVVYEWNKTTSPTNRQPFFATPSTQYELSLTASDGSTTYGPFEYAFVAPTEGMGQLMLRYVDASTSTSPVAGQVVNASGDPVEGVVYAERFTGGSQPSTMATVINATHTDENGKFEMRLPKTSETQIQGTDLRYQFRIVSNETSGSGTPLYYPTTVTNEGDGYAVLDSKTVLPPLSIERGGVVSVALRNGSKPLPSSVAAASLSRTTSQGGRTTRTAETSTFAQMAFGQSSPPRQGSVSLISPASATGSQLGYDVWALGQTSASIDYLCSEAVSVSQGATTDSTCSFEQSGTLNLSVTTYDSAVQRSSGRSESVGDWSYFFENTLVVRNASTGDVVTYVGSGGIQSFFLGGSRIENTSVPLPAGDYTVELYPRYGFMETTAVNHTQTVSVTAGGTTDLTLNRATDFGVEATPGRFPRELTRGAENTVSVSVFDPATGNNLTDTDGMSITGRFLHPNGTDASGPFSMTYNGTASPSTFETTTLKPSALGLDAGRYTLAITATHTASGERYSTRRGFPVKVSGFSTSLELSRRTVAPGGDVSAIVRAFDTTTTDPTPIGAAASDITVTVVDENGKLVSTQQASSGLSSGKTAVSVTMPETEGEYDLRVRVDSTGGEQGIAAGTVRVSDMTVEVRTAKESYDPGETVDLDVSVTNASTGDAVSGAGVTVRMNGNETTNLTDANGEREFTLTPSQFGREGRWPDQPDGTVVVTKETDTGIVRQTADLRFTVQSVRAFVEPRRGSFSPDRNVYLDVFTAPETTVESVRLKQLNDETRNQSATSVASGYHELDLGTLPVGDYTAVVEVTTPSAKQSFRTSFSVDSYLIEVETGEFRYDTGETIPVNVTLRHTNGTVVSGQEVNATLYYAASRLQKDSGSATTGADGTATVDLVSDEYGEHFVEVEADGQTRLLGLQVSSVTATLLDSPGGSPVEGYTWAPGTTQTVAVDVDSGGSTAPDGTTVTAYIDTYDGRTELGTNETDGGEATFDVTVPDDVAAGVYGLSVRAQTDDGTGYTYGTVEIAGGSALSVDVSTGDRVYAPGDQATITATVTDSAGSPVSGKQVRFEVGSKNGSDTTGTDGVAEYTYQVPNDETNGEYVARARLVETPGIKDVSGFSVSSYAVDVTPNESVYAPGDTVGLNVTVSDRSSGSAASVTDGVVYVVSPGGTERLVEVTPSGTSPYTATFDLPGDPSATGSYSVDVLMRDGSAFGVGSTLVEVASATESANLSVSDTVTAGETTTVTVNASVDTTGTLTVFSPDADGSAYRNESVPLSTTDTAVDVTLDSAGVYVFKLEVPDVGTETAIVTVEPAADAVPTLAVGPDLDSTSENFSTSEDIYIRTDQTQATATVVGPDETFEVPLNRQDGGSYYGVLSTQRPADTYLVRLDTTNATAVNETVIEVEA